MLELLLCVLELLLLLLLLLYGGSLFACLFFAVSLPLSLTLADPSFLCCSPVFFILLLQPVNTQQAVHPCV